VVLAYAPIGAREMSANAIDVPLRAARAASLLKMRIAAEADRDGIPSGAPRARWSIFGLGKCPVPALPPPAKCSYERRQLIRKWLRIPTRLKGWLDLFMMPSFPLEGWSSAEAGWIKRPATIRQCDFEGAAMFARHVSLQQHYAQTPAIGESCSMKAPSTSKRFAR
jgi:hypothetical protein